MISLYTKTTLVMCIIGTVTAIPQHGTGFRPGPHIGQPAHLAASHPFTASAPQFDLTGGVLFPDAQSRSNVNRNSVTGRNDISPAQQTQFVWSSVTNGCILGKTEFTFTRINFQNCKAHCQNHSGFECKSVEYNTKSENCILSRFTSKTPGASYRDPCPTDDKNWIYAEVIESVHQTPLQNNVQSQNKLHQVGRTPQNNVQQDNSAPPLDQTSRPLAPSHIQQGGQTTQQPGIPSSQQGSPHTPQNVINQANAATAVPDHFRPETPPATPIPNQVQAVISGATSAVPTGVLGQTSGNGKQRAQVCEITPSPGECRGAFPRFFYDKTKDQCDCFLYGGCGKEALKSSWLTLAECNANCIPGNLEEGSRCKLLPKQDIQTFMPSALPAIDTSNISDSQLIESFQPNKANNGFRPPNKPNNKFRNANQG